MGHREAQSKRASRAVAEILSGAQLAERGEPARAAPSVRAEYEVELKRVAEEVAAGLGGGLPREAAWPLIAQLAGGVLIALADPELAEEITGATLTGLREQAKAASQSGA